MQKFLFFLMGVGVFTGLALADNTLRLGSPTLDRPTLTSIGIELPITGDDDFNASVSVRYRQQGTSGWHDALPLFRVHPENSARWPSVPQFAGTIFDLRPAITYDIELHAVDPDSALDQIFSMIATTRSVPRDPPLPRNIAVQDVAGLIAAVNSARSGDVITLADGVYNVGTLFLYGSGTADNPIVVRGTSEENTILDGGNCAFCNIIEVDGSWVHVERMTLRNAQRGLRFQASGAQGNVLRRVHIKNVQMAIGARENQLDFYICDNTAEGRLTWPSTYRDDNGAHAADDGLAVAGFGHVVCHNRISGFGDAMKTLQDGARALDFYNNDILFSYDNGVELDGSEGNTRVFRNRFTNTYGTLSVQPVHGGPAYLIRNVVLNVADEQMKFHALGTTPPQEPNGVLAFHNTFVSPYYALNLNTPNASHHFVIENNLFVTVPSASRVVNWNGPIDSGTFDYNGYWPDGTFVFNLAQSAFQSDYRVWPNLAAVQAGGMEQHGTSLTTPIFAKGVVASPDYLSLLSPVDVSLAPGSNAIDRALVLHNINDSFTGAGPDLGALETGCPLPVYGPRPEGMDETNEPFGCEATTAIPIVGVSLTPVSISLGNTQTQQFVAALSGTSNTAVSWSISPSTGSISSVGVYTAPVSISAPFVVTVKATSQADPTKVATASVTLTPPLGSNLARGKPAAQSSTYPLPSAGAGSAVDGSTDGNFWDNSVTHTNLDMNSWWQVDLGSSATVSSISVWNRTDCCASRLTDYWIFLSDTPFSPADTPATLQNRAGTWSSHQIGSPSPSTMIAVGNAQGRYVRVQLSGFDYLSLAEIQVLGTAGAPSLSRNLAQAKAASQSSTYPTKSAGPGSAVDGNTDGIFLDGSVSHTLLDANAWWQVDLGAQATLDSIVIWNRTDCCSDRLTDYWVFVSNTPFRTSDTPATLQTRAGTWSKHQITAVGPVSTIAVGGAQGQYVRLQLSGTNYLSLAEVQVNGTSP